MDPAICLYAIEIVVTGNPTIFALTSVIQTNGQSLNLPCYIQYRDQKPATRRNKCPTGIAGLIEPRNAG